MYHEIQIRPRFSETDANGHINNTVPAVWFEEGRATLVREVAGVRPSIIIARFAIDFLREMIFGHPVTLRSGIARFGDKSFVQRQEAWQRGQLCARAETVECGWDPVNRRTVRISDEIRAALAPYMFEDAAGEPAARG
jgi:acyl-CoA thioester hydrolase